MRIRPCATADSASLGAMRARVVLRQIGIGVCVCVCVGGEGAHQSEQQQPYFDPP